MILIIPLKLEFTCFQILLKLRIVRIVLCETLIIDARIEN